MTLTITIDLENAAFGHAGSEISRILKELAKEYKPLLRANSLDGKKLCDINGNTVGDVRITE